ncbi:MAG: GHKL domain-containing protein [Lachnospiraceae bacterium]|nr:GHKL domain-containing protein [Lachnospiraceae bacterium]
MIFRKIAEFNKRIVELDKAEEYGNFKKHRIFIMSIGISILLLFCLIFCIYPMLDGNYSLFMTYAFLIFFLGVSLILLYRTESTGTAATIAGCGCFLVFAVSFYINPYPENGGLDAFWLWMLLIPFMADYFAGLITGFQISLGGFILSVIYMWILKDHFSGYGEDILFFYPIIYLVSVFIAWIQQYEIVYNHNEELRAEEAEKMRQQDRLKNMEKELRAYEENIKLVNRHQHDMRHYTRVLRQMLNEGDSEKALNYLEDLDDSLSNVPSMTYCDNRLINGILSVYHERLRKLNCHMKIRAGVPEKLSITDFDLSALISNILENAAEALEKLPEYERTMDVKLDHANGKLKGMIVNSCVPGTKFNEEGLPESTKKIKSGIGTKNIRMVAEKYGGTVGFDEKDGCFTTKFVLAC